MTFETTTASENQSPAALYSGKVMHARLKPVSHRFKYTVFSLLIDLDRLEEANRMSPVFSVNSGNLVAFHEKDHGLRDNTPLRTQIDRLLASYGHEAAARVCLWCSPSIFGYTFNPLSVYYCYNAAGDVYALVYQVHNTFGEAHSYVAGVDPSHTETGSMRQSADKRFYVSPFLDMDLRYDFRIGPPDEALRIRILEHDQTGPVLAATFSGLREPLSSANLLLGICKTAGLTWKITAGIHFEALLLWLKGMSVKPRPAPPEPFSQVQNPPKPMGSRN